MSGHSLAHAIELLDDDVDPAGDVTNEVNVQRYDSEELEDDDTSINEDDYEGVSFSEHVPPEFIAPLEEFELPKFELQGGDIFPGDVLELHDHTERNLGYLFSGDFLLVRSIVENVKTEEVILRGYRLRRCAYLQPLFDRRFNDLFMLIEVSEHDPKPRFVQGLEDVSPTEVIQKRRCVFTHLDHELMNVSHTNKFAPARVTKEDKLKEWIFEHGTLICRWVHVVELHPTGQSCGGEARRMYKREATSFTNNESLTQPLVKTQSDPASGPLHNRKRVQSDEDVIFCPAKRHQRLPEKTNMMSLGDGFCGAGGVSQGAREAGYKIAWGLENEAYAMAAYKKNFPEAMHLEMDAHDFPDIAKRCTQGCDHLHMSCPCCFWSEAHTSDGKNDEKNMMTLYTVEAWLKALKPKAFSLEQAPGLLKLAKHRVYFRKLINDILSRGYAVRWKIQDQAWFGIPQHRRRLVFIGVKIGIPLPPFPAPIYGPPKSGLKRYVTIEDSLKVIERQAMSFRTDIYHQPLFEKRLDLPSIDPHVNLAKCVTTSGGDNVHYSGKRANTVRELASFQGLPPDFKFAGSVTEAKKQCGNTWPAKANKVYFALWAAHREAFDNGLINAEDEILDLYAFLEAKGVDIPKPPVIDVDMFDTPHRSGFHEPAYRYLCHIEKTVKPNYPLQLWGQRKEIDRLPRHIRQGKPIPSRRGKSRPTDEDNGEGSSSGRAAHRGIPSRPRNMNLNGEAVPTKSSPFVQKRASQSSRPRHRASNSFEPMNLLNGLIGDEVEDDIRPTIERPPRQLPRKGSVVEDAIELPSDSDDEYEADSD